ncbi:MAG: electron transport complex subunit E [Clostridiaceae bacterium]|nr:electron transport complex subunit E [Clostridiaceae bacterium]
MADKKKSLGREFTKGLLDENPVLRLVLGTCPTLAVSTSVVNAVGMGISAMIVLVCSNIVISLLRKIIPSKVRIPAYIVIIASFVTIVQMIVKAFVPALDAALGVFLPLIVVNCIILGRAEAFAGKNSVIASAVDGLGMGVGFTIALCCMASVREILGAGTFLAGAQNLLVLFGENVLNGFNGFTLIPQDGVISPMMIFILAPGGFFTFGILMACANRIAEKKGKPKADLGGCKACPMAKNCAILAEGKGCGEKKEGEQA